MRIFLIGFMGSGKTYSGHRLAKLLGFPFYDLDARVEKEEGASVREIFEQQGEEYFRLAEQRALHDTAQFPKAVVACGGGTPCFFDNMDWMLARGLTVYLKTPVAVLAARLAQQRQQRPLIREMEAGALEGYIQRKLSERESFYLRSSIIYQQENLQDDVAATLFHQFENIIGH